MKKEECLPLTRRSFSVLIRHYEDEAAAASAMASNNSEDSFGTGNDMAVVAQYMEDLANDAKELYCKLQTCAKGTPDWSVEDIRKLRLLGFDVSHICMDKVENSCAHTPNIYSTQRSVVPSFDSLLAAEKKMQLLQMKVDNLEATNASLRHALTFTNETSCRQKETDNDTSNLLLVLAQTLKELKESYYHHRYKNRSAFSSVEELREKVDFTPHDITASDQKSNSAVEESTMCSPSGALEGAFRILRRVDICHRVRYSVGDVSNNVGPVDMAVVQLLNDLDFPFPVQLRRLGPGGDYFIDRRVEIRLVEGQLIVRPWPSSSFPHSVKDPNGPPRYEHLAKYLIHLYSPAIDFDGATRENVSNAGLQPSDKSCSTRVSCDDDIVSLKRQQRELQRVLENRYAQLKQHQRQLEAGLSPSPNIYAVKYDTTSDSVSAPVNEGAQIHRESPFTSQHHSPPTDTEERMAHIFRLLEVNGRAHGFPKCHR